MWMTFGVRARPVKGLNVDLAVDKGVLSPGYSYGSPVVPWNIIFGLSYAYDPIPPVRVVREEVVKEVVKEVAEEEMGGKLRGRVIDAQTLEPVEGGVVTYPGKDLTGQSTDPDGTFLSYELPPGNHPIMVRHPDYEPAKITVQISTGAVAAKEIPLTPSAPKHGRLVGQITASKGGDPVSATVAVSGPESRQVTAGPDGRFSVELRPGTYTLAVTADKYLRKERTVGITAGAELSTDFTLSRKPRRPLVKVTRRQLVIRRKIHFNTGTANIQPDSKQVLDAVVHTLLTNPNIKRVEIGGHTDNRGSDALNQRLSLARAESVKEYLVNNGVSEERLVTKGYGASRPKVPNITARNRARNRRVEFMILRQ
jgi:outer membrane protein OmpA-like peptidoglycan-associated protein